MYEFCASCTPRVEEGGHTHAENLEATTVTNNTCNNFNTIHQFFDSLPIKSSLKIVTLRNVDG